MKLIVGLGNPGCEYSYTRHNIGFLSIDKLVVKFNLTKPRNVFNAFVWETAINNEKVLFCQPQTFMNLSGDAVLLIKQFYKLTLEDIIVIYDDKDLAFNVIKLKKNGSSAGHNGIKDLIHKLGSENFLRIKLGVGKHNQIPLRNWVLGKFSADQLAIINNDLLERVSQIISQYLVQGDSFDKLMSLYNGK
ncbi:aminoacyl-tRNA hydrolase [Spiroplasma poulsonii]|uniref:Peptidyl-tRNA hydrolase n=1 Tax=Spiroplasma poulsonii TaxID=2138 RepID=A0A433ESR6_9MOLU|nr:aminoacyl-tRNA hydrolase [Spiroplasma poulsonii]MBW3057959.1 aminoacyl-tRNA hydrolase [Spiroplasma poulsonii]RUP77962.1 aminoacyl-tRNA hydrolase [Spiroplasma poulsonii]